MHLEWTILGTRPPHSQRVKAEFGTTNLRNNPFLETHKIQRTDQTQVTTQEFAHMCFFHSGAP